MSELAVPETKPEDRISLRDKIIYGSGAFINNLLSGSVGAMFIVFNLYLGVSPIMAGLLGALPRLFDAFTDPMVGFMSDNTRTKWGRRRPYIFFGAIATGLIYIVMWQFPDGMSPTFYFTYFLVMSMFFFLAYTAFITPWVALGYEMTSDYNERSRLMGIQNMIGNIAYFIPPFLMPFAEDARFFDNAVDGIGKIAIAIGVVAIVIGVMPAIFLREKTVVEDTNDQSQPPATVLDQMQTFLAGFLKAIQVKPFMKLCITTLLVFNAFMLVAAFQTYVMIYYVFDGNRDYGFEYMKYIGIIGTVVTIAAIYFVSKASTVWGKRRTLVACIGISMLGYALKWFCYSKAVPALILIPVPLIVFGLGGLFTLVPSMIADVVDYDELHTSERREGMFGSIFWWVVKLGLTLALFGGGALLQATGFDESIAFQTDQTLFLMKLFDVIVPVVGSAVALFAILSFEITPERAQEIREELEARRGTSRETAASPA